MITHIPGCAVVRLSDAAQRQLTIYAKVHVNYIYDKIINGIFINNNKTKVTCSI
jgi:hypothetical protein